ncbi:TPA: transcriptional regulator CysB, partial [Klebsiella pneumoniae]|nr:transcriptional regulator CysB [Klebsiella pneumoniae]
MVIVNAFFIIKTSYTSSLSGCIAAPLWPTAGSPGPSSATSCLNVKCIKRLHFTRKRISAMKLQQLRY